MGDVESNTKGALDALDALDDMTAICTCGSMCLDYIAQQMIWGHAKPPMSYLLETYGEKGGEVAKTYIFKDKRSAAERMCKMKMGHWTMYELGAEGKEDDYIMKSNYRRNFCKLRTHYVMKDKEGNFLASHQLKDPVCNCDCSCEGCKRMCCMPCYMCANACSSYRPIASYMTPTVPLTPENGPPKFVQHYKIEEGFRLMGYSCIGLFCGKSHSSVEFPTFFTAAKEVPADAEVPEAEGAEKKKKLGDNRVLVKDKNPCYKMSELFAPAFDALPLDGLGEIGELVETAKEVADEAAELRKDMEDAEGGGDVDKKAGQGNVKWARSKNDTYGIEYPRHFTSSQRLGMVLAALEYDMIANA